MPTAPLDNLPPDEVMFGLSTAMATVRQRAEKVCNATVPVLLQGDGGTGKEALARWIHKHSRNPSGQFVKVSCGAIPGSLLESELFGYERGAFTGANASKPGKVELAEHGTLFLDEIADLDSNLQSKLLQFLPDGRFFRLGGEQERFVQTRLICATNKNLEQEMDAGRFRPDLYYRINVVCIRLPRLSERKEDIALLAGYFLKHFGQEFQRTPEPLTREMLRHLENLVWPGNIRELSNTIARHVLIRVEDTGAAPISYGSGTGAASRVPAEAVVPLKQIAKQAIREKERSLILEVLQANRWNRRKAAEALGISYRTLIYKIRDAGFRSNKSAPSGRDVANPPAQSSSD